MRFLLLSGDGDGLGVAMRLKDEGHDVTVAIRNRKAKRDYQGLLRKVDKFDSILTPDTIVVMDSSGGGRTADRLRGQSYAVVGGSMFADQLELDRAMALGLMEEAGIKTPPSQHFTDWDEAIKYAATKERLCCKSDNDLPSYLASSPEDMIDFLKFHQKVGETPDFELQDFVKGLELSSEGWFDGGEFSRPFNHTFERKQLMNGDIGPSGGCSGCVTWACQHDSCAVIQQGIAKMAPILRHHGYHGPLDLNTIVNDEGVWGLEFTPRFGYDAFPALMETLTEGVGDTLARYARQERVSKFPMKLTGFGGGLRVSIPPYPSDDVTAPEGIAIRGLVRADRPHAYFYNVLLDKDMVLRSSGAWGAIAVFTGFGEDIASAMAGPLAIARRAEIRDVMFRTDLAEVFEQSYGEYLDFNRPKPVSEDSPLAMTKA